MSNIRPLPNSVYEEVKEKAGEISDLLDDFQEMLSGDPRLSYGLENEEIELMDECRNLLSDIYYHPQRITYGDSDLDNNEQAEFDFVDWASEKLHEFWEGWYPSINSKRDIIYQMCKDIEQQSEMGEIDLWPTYENDIIDFINEHYDDYGW